MLIVVTGVPRSGKTTLGSALSRRLGVPFVEAASLSDLRPSAANPATPAAQVVAVSTSSLAAELVQSRGPDACVIALELSREEAERRIRATSADDAASEALAQLGRAFDAWRPPAEAFVVAATLSSTEIVERAIRHLVRRGHPGGSRLHFAEGARNADFDSPKLGELVDELLKKLGPLRRVLLIPPDFTRFHSGAGELTSLLYARLARQATVEVLPALGTHAPMTEAEIAQMFPGVPSSCFRIHEWRSGLTHLGDVPASFVRAVSNEMLDYSIRCEVDARLLAGWDRIISIGQLVPHEVIGIASHDKNIFVGTGGKDVIDRTHFLGAVCGMESVMGRAHSPVRDVLRYMAGSLGVALPITHLLSVRERVQSGKLVTRGLFAGDDFACFTAGAPLVQACNLELFEKPLKKVVVYLDPSEFKSTWLGNKAIYRTRMALADQGELIVIGPGIARFGEDPDIDRLIRRHGYHGTPRTLRAVREDPELATSLSAAAHLIHGSSEGRFRVAYACGALSREEIGQVGYDAYDLENTLERYDPTRLRPGMNTLADGEEVFFVPNPALGLWGLRRQFEGTI